jgi:glycosyltransferase involved in cell wall biosynthesis
MTPILIVSDAPTSGTGLGRITADLASRIASNMQDACRVATLGYGGIASRHLSHQHYTAEGMDGWLIPSLPEVWDDWAGREKGIILFVSDPSRLQWFSRPEMSEELAKHPGLKQFLSKPSFEKWIYAPVDASGPNDRLTFPLAQNLLGFDRILAYGKFGEDVIRRTLGEQESEKRHLTSLPHGIDTDVFYPRNKQTSRAFFFSFTGAASIFGKKDLIKQDELLIGCVATNQFRKDMPLLIETVAILSRERKIRLWLHTDSLERSSGWSIPALLADHGLLDRAVVSLGHIADEAMAKAYSACDLTLAPGPEGWGFPIAESLACGTPVVHGSYAGGADIVPTEMQVPPVAFRYEGIWASKRPVYRPEDWAAKANEWAGRRARLDTRYSWTENWKAWEAYLREAVR